MIMSSNASQIFDKSVIVETLRFAFFALRVTCNVWESHVCDRKPQVTRSSNTFCTCRPDSTCRRPPHEFSWRITLCFDVRRVQTFTATSVLYL